MQDRLDWPPRDHVVYKALLGQRMSIEEFTGKTIRFQPEEHYAQEQYDVVLL